MQLISGVAIGAEWGGAELHAIHIAQHLDRERYTPAIYALSRYNSRPEAEWLERLTALKLPVYGMLPSQSTRRQSLSDLWDAVSEFRPHIIHSHSERTDTLNLLLRRRHAVKPRGVRTVHIDQKWITRPYLRWLMEGQLLPRFLDHQTAVSQTIYEQLLARGNYAQKTTLCYNGIDEAAFAPDFAAEQQLLQPLPGEPPYMGIVGRLTRQKGHDLLLAAMQEVMPRFPGHLLIVGDGPLAPLLQEQAHETGFGDRIHFLGARKDVFAILQQLDLFVLPSRWEGFPTVILEAMSQRVPVIATSVSGSRSLVRDGDTGLLISPEDVAALVQAIIRLLSDSALADTLTKHAFTHAAHYTIQAMAECYGAVYAQVSRATKAT